MSEPTSIGALIDPDTFQRDVRITEGNLDIAFRDQASLYASYAVASFKVMQYVASRKLRMEIIEAQIDKRMRDEATAASASEDEDAGKKGAKTPKLTEKQIEQAIARDPEYVKAQMAYNEAVALQALAATALEAFKQRRDMLIQLGANVREEMKGDLVMRSRGAVG